MRYSELYSVFKYLKKALPPQAPVNLKRVPMVKYDGMCIDRGDRFMIHIDSKLSEIVAIDVMLHEMAHVLSWGKDKDVHGRNWGLAYSLVYRTYLAYEDTLPLRQGA